MGMNDRAGKASGFDVIGDIHGNKDGLTGLLEHLGYNEDSGTYHHRRGRIAVFLGDYINKGPEPLHVVKIIKNMVEAGNAVALMGNHELRAILSSYKPEMGYYKGEHSFYDYAPHGSSEYDDCIAFFKTLHPFYQIGQAKFVHAYWDPASVEIVREYCNPDLHLNGDVFQMYLAKQEPAYSALSTLLHGQYLDLPPGLSFNCATGIISRRPSIMWWRGEDIQASEKIVVHGHKFTDRQLEAIDTYGLHRGNLKNSYKPHAGDGSVYFFGHYQLTKEFDSQTRRHVCLDYGSSAIVCYRISRAEMEAANSPGNSPGPSLCKDNLVVMSSYFNSGLRPLAL